MRLVRFASLALLASLATARPAAAVYATDVRAGCYIAAPNDCRVRMSPVTIATNPAARVLLVQVYLNGTVVYDFHTDSSDFYRPAGPYTVPLPSLDLGATCGSTQYLSVIARDTLDPSVYVVANTDAFTCPSSIP
jgi:hypothetical protein